MTAVVTLQPCLRCGGALALHDNDWADPVLWSWRCASCGLFSKEFATQAEAAADANRRPLVGAVEMHPRDIGLILLQCPVALGMEGHDCNGPDCNCGSTIYTPDAWAYAHQPLEHDIEAAAKRIFRSHNGEAINWDDAHGTVRDGCRRLAQAALQVADSLPTTSEQVQRGGR